VLFGTLSPESRIHNLFVWVSVCVTEIQGSFAEIQGSFAEIQGSLALCNLRAAFIICFLFVWVSVCVKALSKTHWRALLRIYGALLRKYRALLQFFA